MLGVGMEMLVSAAEKPRSHHNICPVVSSVAVSDPDVAIVTYLTENIRSSSISEKFDGQRLMEYQTWEAVDRQILFPRAFWCIHMDAPGGARCPLTPTRLAFCSFISHDWLYVWPQHLLSCFENTAVINLHTLRCRIMALRRSSYHSYIWFTVWAFPESCS